MRDDSETTLPSVEAALPDLQMQSELILTVVFHPDVSRIGEFAVVRRGQRELIVGRKTPVFSRHLLSPDKRAGHLADVQQAMGLNDGHVSRQVMELDTRGESVKLRRSGDGCRCRIDGRELDGEATLTPARLQQGVPILIAHSIALLLRLAPPPQGSAQGAGDGMVGSSAYMRHLREQISLAAASDLDVLITGATGTGKELVARAIHAGSRRRQGPLVSVNVAAIPAGLAAASLFGAERGAFTGAERARTGYFQQAAAGTLFLDEIGDAPEELQPQLLRALQQREIQVVGGPIKSIDVRVISATDAELEGERCGFKAALRHRLGGIEIPLRSLQAHPEDIGELLRHHLQHSFSEAGRAYLLPQADMEPGLVAAWAAFFHGALQCRWPGNVRQLANICAQLAVASRSKLALPPSVVSALSDKVDSPEQDAGSSPADAEPEQLYRRIAEVADEEFDRAMEACYFEPKGAAGRLGVSRQAVYRRIKTTKGYRLASQVPEPEMQQVMDHCGGDVRAAAMKLRVSASGIRARMRQSGG